MIPNNFFLYWQGKEFSIHQYICVKSIFEIEHPDNIWIYTNDPLPNNIWWERTCSIAKIKTLIAEEFSMFGHLLNNATSAQQRSDIFRALVLYEYGGIYTDFDTLTIRSIQPLIKKDAFIASCRYATSWNENGQYVGIKRDAQPPFSHLANGNLGSIAKHPYLKFVLKEFEHENCSDINKPGIFKFINAYELNKSILDIQIMPWYIFHCINERTINKFDKIRDGGISLRIEEFFQQDKPINPKAHVIHYYSSKQDCAHLLTKCSSAYLIKYGTSRYCDLARKYVEEFCPNWKNDGYIISPDRIILEQKILPRLTGDVCFVGVASYTKHYWNMFFTAADSVTTIDFSKRVAKYGATRHIRADVKYLATKSDKLFNYIVMHGIAGFGTFTMTQLRYAFAGAFQALKPGGILIYGWANNPKIRVAHPNHLFKESFGTSDFKSVPFFDLPSTVITNEYIDPNIEYNVPLNQIIDMQVQFMFFEKPNDQNTERISSS